MVSGTWFIPFDSDLHGCRVFGAVFVPLVIIVFIGRNIERRHNNELWKARRDESLGHNLEC